MNDKYIKMCATSDTVQNLKEGFEDGDLLYDGEKVRVVAEDFIKIGKWILPGNNIIEVAIKDSDSKEIVRYDRRTLKDAKQIPRVSDIADLLTENRTPYELIRDLEDYVTSYVNYCEDATFDEIMLKFYMETKHGKVWTTKNEWKGLNEVN